MDAVVRAAAIYFAMVVMFRLAGRRSLADLTTFDFLLLLIIGEATQQALLGEDFSVTNGVLVIATLIGIDVAFGFIKRRSQRFAKLVDGVPMLLVENGRPLPERMRRARVDVADVLLAARQSHGLERLDQIKFAVLEISGGITVIPQQDAD